MDPAEYVLQPFSSDEEPVAAAVIERAVAATECWLAEGIVPAMDRFNRVSDSAEPIPQERC
jgi:peptidyl-tRNA hydrolase